MARRHSPLLAAFGRARAFCSSSRTLCTSIRALLSPRTISIAGPGQFPATDIRSLAGASSPVSCHTLFLLPDMFFHCNNHLAIERPPVPISYPFESVSNLKREIKGCPFRIFHDGILTLRLYPVKCLLKPTY